MRDNKKFIINEFEKVKRLGFVKSNRKNNTGIGKTFEDYMGVVENNFEAPDLAGYEIKSHREEVASYITLFTKVPDFPKQPNSYLNSRFGSPYEDNPDLKKLHISMFATHLSSNFKTYSFKLINDRNLKAIRIGVYDYNTERLIDSSVGYTYETIEMILKKKLKNLFYVSAEREMRGNDEYFNFNHAEIYSNPSLEKFLDLIDKGKIMYDIRIGSFKSGKAMGKTHDHGSGFRILEKNITLLYELHETV
ncbi:MAG: MvaI/BcnI restriction endonuclease family protein [Muribaculaceae bacterium]|jgi:hypothetical protein|nr:MvaI/BcnI restriction endonuclease family protein [Muribaculaceae bacterium]